jgi:GH15 family glucan-1,4-alpha-glucosidase
MDYCSSQLLSAENQTHEILCKMIGSAGSPEKGPMPKRIEDYALIGDGQSAALVGRNGSIDWLCWPRFDSDACFAALLGGTEHGCWMIAPENDTAKITRAYCENTLVLETAFTTPTGTVRLVDFMPIRRGESSAIIRVVSGVDGTVSMRTDLRLRFNYGSIAPWFSEKDGVLVGKVGPDLVTIRSNIALTRDDETVSAHFDIQAGERVIFTLQYAPSNGPLPPPLDVDRLLASTKTWWLNWISQFRRTTDWPEFVKRSLIILKALTYFPTGGIVAAPTTSLPERPGGRMNWDYRYCWLRDSTFMMTAFLNAGLKEEARSWVQWLLRAVAGTPDKIRIAYRIDGGRRLEEWEADWLPGFGGARPVRIGNRAASQRQLDIFGEVLDSSHIAERAGLERDDWEIEIEQRLVLHVAEIWRQPDQGLWESRGPARHHVYSKVMAWVAVDRFLKMEKAQAEAPPELHERLRKLREEMHREICQRGFSEKQKTFVAHYGSRRLDASLLLLPLVGFLPVDDLRISSTITAIETNLMEGGLVRRHKASPLGSEEGVFIACSCWLADCMNLQGRHEQAHQLLSRVIALANDVGLLSEEYHVPQKRLLGNIPQALSHLAVVNSILGLSGPVLQRGGG